MSKSAKIALTVAAAGGALVAGMVLVPRLLRRGVVKPGAPAPMTSAPPPAPPPTAPRPVPSSSPGGTLGDINNGLAVPGKAFDLLDRLGLGGDDGGLFANFPSF